MATQVPALRKLLCVDELDRKLIDLGEQVEFKKKEVRSNFQQLHCLLAARETFLLKEMDDVVTQARQEVAKKRANLQRLYTTKEGIETDMAQNKLKKVLEKNLLVLESEIREEVARGVNVGWIELDWKRERLEQSLIKVCIVVALKERPRIDYSTKMCPVWSREGTGLGAISDPMQLVIDGKTQKIFVADYGETKRIQVYDGEGNHLYKISTPPRPIGIAVTDTYIFVSTYDMLVKIRKSNNKFIKSIETENRVWGIDTNANTDVYGCEIRNQSIVVYDKDLIFQKRIQLRTTQIEYGTFTNSIKLYENMMYVMFGGVPPPFRLQIFNLEGQLMECLIEKNEIVSCDFFSIDRLGNIIVTDWDGFEIKIFSKEGDVLHTITSAMLPGDEKFFFPSGVAIDKQDRIIVAHTSKKCNLLAF